MRVLHVAFDSGEVCVRLASAMVGLVDEVGLLLPEQHVEPHRHELDPAVTLHAFRRPRLRQPLRQVRTMRWVVAAIRRFDPDVIHYQKGHLWFNLTLPLLRRFPLVVSIHDPRRHMGDHGAFHTPQAVLDLAYRRADRVIAHAKEMKTLIVDELKIPPAKVDVIPLIALGNGDLGAGIEEEQHTVLFQGRIWGYKGLDYLIRAEPLISARVPDVKFVIAGEGEDFARYRRLMRDPDRFVVYNEFVSFEKREELFRQASVVVLPYVEATQSGVVPVAYTHGKPVVATEVGGLPSQVDDGHTGFLVPPRDVAALADRVVQLLEDAELRTWMGANGRRKLTEEWSPAAVARQTIPVYVKAIEAAEARTGKLGTPTRDDLRPVGEE